MKKALRATQAVSFAALASALLVAMLYVMVLRTINMGLENNSLPVLVFICFAIGGFLMMGIYSHALHMFQSKDTASLFFALFCYGNAFRFVLWKSGPTPFLFPGLAITAMDGIRQIFQYLTLVALLGFVFTVFGKTTSAKLKATVAISAALVTLVYLNFLRETPLGRALVLATGLFTLGTLLYIIAKSAKSRQRPLTVLYFVSFILYIISFVANVMLPYTDTHLPVISNYFFAIVHILFLAARYADAMRTAERANQELEQKVAEQTKELRAANASMKELITAMSHDLKTPLAVMGVELEKLGGLAEGKGEGLEKAVRLAYGKSLDLQHLVQNLLDASRLERGVDYECLPVAVSRLLADMQHRYGELVESTGLSFDVAMETDAALMIDPRRIWSVFDNLIYNVLRYTQTGGISVTAGKATNGSLCLTIKDTGPGVAAEHLPHLFERFYKASAGRGGKDGDSGLGLYIVSSTMAAMGGSAQVESEEGKGFAVLLSFSVGSAKEVELRRGM